MRVGTVCYATEQGLGILAKSFYDAGVVTDPLIVEHAHYGSHLDWYPEGTPRTPARNLNGGLLREHCKKVDVMLFFETPFSWSLIPECRKLGVKTVLMPMYECMPKALPFEPDLYLCPSALDLQYYADKNAVHVPVPVGGITWHRREKARTFVHNAGRLGLRYRNGTGTVLDAMKHVESDCRLILRSQKALPWAVPKDRRIDARIGSVESINDLYDEGDVFLFPEKFNGLSLPAQEAFAAGMGMMVTRRFPNTEYLPGDMMIPVRAYELTRVAGRCLEFEEAVVDPRDVAATIDAWFNRDISSLSEQGREFARANSWEALRPKYLEVLRSE